MIPPRVAPIRAIAVNNANLPNNVPISPARIQNPTAFCEVAYERKHNILHLALLLVNTR